MGRTATTLALVCALALSAPQPLHAQKTDVVILRNGDKLTGEVKNLERGKLEYSTDDMARVNIEWNKIARVSSRNSFEVETRSGRRFFGSIGEGAEDRLLVVYIPALDTLPEIADTLFMPSVVRITQLKTTFWQRWSGYIDLGFSFTQANTQLTWNVGFETTYRPPTRALVLAYTSYFNTQTNQNDVSRHTVSFNFQQFLKQRWALSTFTQLQQNSELQLDLRIQLGLGAGRNMIQTNNMQLVLVGALLWAKEQYATADTAVKSLEGLVTTKFEAFRFHDPEFDNSSTLNIFPSITDLGRVRLELNNRTRWEIFKDFYFGFTVYFTYDSRPPSNTPQTDLALTTSIGWSY